MLSYKVEKAENGYIVIQNHSSDSDPQHVPYGTSWIFNGFDGAIELLARKFAPEHHAVVVNSMTRFDALIDKLKQ